MVISGIAVVIEVMSDELFGVRASYAEKEQQPLMRNKKQENTVSLFLILLLTV